MMERFFRFSKMPFSPHKEGIVKRFVSNENITFVQYEAKKGAHVPTHKHSTEQFSFIKTGKVEIVVGKEKYILEGGDLLVIDKDKPHSLLFLEDTEGFEVHSPPRDDWKK